MGRAPGHVAIVVGRAGHGVGLERLVPALGPDVHAVGWHTVVAAGLQGAHALGDKKRLARKLLGHGEEVAVVVIESDDVEGSRAEEMIAGVGLIAAGRDGARAVVVAHHIGELDRKQRVDAHGRIFVGELIGAVAEVEQQIGLVHRESVGIGVAPLLEHLIADAPHDDRRMIAVAQQHIAQVALVPLVEVSRVVVGGLALAPHVKALVHHHQAHAVAEVEQLGGRRIVRHSYGVCTHVAHHGQLALDGAAVDHGAQGAGVVMQTHSIDFHRPVIKEKSPPGVEAEFAQAGGDAVCVDGTAADAHVGHQAV